MIDALQPRGLGDIISTTFGVYQRRYLPLLAIAAVAELAYLIVGFVLVGIVFGSVFEEIRSVFDSVGTSQAELELAVQSFIDALADNLALIIIGFLIVGVAGLVITTLTFGAFAFCVADFHVRGEMSLGRAFPFALNRLGAMLGAEILSGLLLLVIVIAVGGISTVLGPVAPLLTTFGFIVLISVLIYVGISLTLILPAALLEGAGPLGALSRSWKLVGGSWWRVFGILLMVFLIIVVIGLVLGMTLGLIPVVGGYVGNIIIAPIFPIASMLLYIDLRVRDENYSLGEMARELHLEFNPDAA